MKYAIAILAVLVIGLALLAFAPKPPPPPTVVAGSAMSGCGTNPAFAYRFWSDGVIDVTRIKLDNETQCFLEGPPCTIVVVQ